MPKNILVIWDRMGDYHRARWRALQSAYTQGAVYAADLGGSDQVYGWETTNHSFDYFLLSNRPADKFDFRRITRFVRVIREGSVGIVCVAGYGKPEYLFFILIAYLYRRKVILFAESWYPSGKLLDTIKSFFLRLTCSGFLVSGERAKRHFVDRLKINASKVQVGYSVVDNDHFVNATMHGSPPAKIMLCVARFAPEKNLESLIITFRESRLEKCGWQLVIVGGGPLQDQLAKLASGYSIRLLPWQSYKELPSLYQMSRVFILPSKFEPWGLVVNEAMAAGLPIILSTEVGCVPDFLSSNGWSFDPQDSGSLQNVFEELACMDTDELDAKGRESKERVKDFTPEFFGRKVLDLVSNSNA